jgi:hypothetical protein
VTSPTTSEDRVAFYRAAVLGLRALDARDRTGRRFGTGAEARWTQFAGALGACDRLDILLRDAAVSWGAAFSPAECFGSFGLANDEPFGPDWRGIDDEFAVRLLAESDESAPLDRVASALGVTAASVPAPKFTPATKVVVAGGGALVTVASEFAVDRALSWTDQVVVVADNAAFRQLAGLAAVLLGARTRTVIVRSNADAASIFRAAGFAHIDAAIVSHDAEPAAAALARSVGGK